MQQEFLVFSFFTVRERYEKLVFTLTGVSLRVTMRKTLRASKCS